MILREPGGKNIEELYGLAEAALDAKALADRRLVTDAVGQSMQPTILSGDRIEIDRVPAGALSPGDIIAFRKGRLLICHRIKAVREESGQLFFVTAGDAYLQSDPFEVTPPEIAGKVVGITRAGRGVRTLRGIRETLKRVLRVAGCYRPIKQILFRLMCARLEYCISIPRDKKTHPANRYIDIPLGPGTWATPDFFKPLDAIGEFRILAFFGTTRVAYADVSKRSADGDPGGFWATDRLWITDIFTETDMEKALVTRCALVLNRAGLGALRPGNKDTISRPGGFPEHFGDPTRMASLELTPESPEP